VKRSSHLARAEPEPPAANAGGEAPNTPARTVERMAFRLNELALSIGMSRRALERERAAGRFPAPDRYIGKCPVWAPATIHNWIRGGRP
jgi:hypothetical protein